MNEESLFHLAREKPPGERAAFLDQACAGDAALRRRLEVLLVAHDDPDSLLDQPALESTADAGGNRGSDPAVGPPPEQASEAPEVVYIPGYELLGELGRGGMGVVYKARQLGADRLVALKMVLAGAGAGPADLARFRTEAEAVARLQHPNIVQIYEVGTWQGRPFFSLEYAGGGSLANHLDGTPLLPRTAAELVETLTRAVQAAHERDIVHRDLKPGNVLLVPVPGRTEPKRAPFDFKPPSFNSAAWVPKIGDFGLAKKLDQSAAQTASGAILGTPSYMAPEQAKGEAKGIGPAADVYALGTILYELLTGRPPFRAATPLETVLQVIGDDPVPPSRLAKTPPDLEAICLKCLRKTPRFRYASAQALADDLRRFLDHVPVQARQVGGIDRTARWVRRRPVQTIGSLLLGIFLVLGIRWTITKEKDAQLARTQAKQAKTEAVDAADRAAKSFRQAERQHYLRCLVAADRAWSAGRVPRALQLLDECRPGANPPDGAERGRQGQQASEPAPRDLRHWEWHHLRRRCRQRLLILPVSAGFLYFSGSGRQLFLDLGLISLRKPVPTTDWWSPGWVRGWDAHSGEEVTDWRDAGLSLNGDGRRLAVTRSRTAKVFDLDAGKKLFTISRLPSAWPVRFRSHGQWLFQLHSQAVGPHRADIWEAATGKHRLSLYVGDTFFSPDGRRLVTANIMRDRLGMGYVAGELRCLNLSTGKELYTCPGVWAAFSPDGKRFVTGGRPIAKHDGKVRVRDAASGRELVALELGGGNRQPIGAARFSPDGKRLVTFSSRDWWPSETILWDAVKGKKLLTLPLL